MTLGPDDFDIDGGNSETFYVPGHPDFDAYRVEFDSANSGSTDVDVEFRTYDKDDVRAADSNSDFSSMEEVATSTTNDVSSGDPHVGHHGFSRVVAIQVTNNATAGTRAAGTIVGHNASDPAEHGNSFANR